MVHIDKDLRPAYYDAFHCLADGCHHSCCEGWKISFDKKDYLVLKRTRGSEELNERLDTGVHRIRKGALSDRYYGEIVLKDGVCPLQREDGLCRLQAEKGAKALPGVCRRFPRSEVYMPTGYWERSLSPACEAVLALLWDLPDGVEFVSDPLPKEKWRQYHLSEDAPLRFFFAEIRSLCIDFLQNRRLPLPERILLMGAALRELADGETDVPHWLDRQSALLEAAEPGVLKAAGQERPLTLFLFNTVNTLLSIQSSDRRFPAAREDVLRGIGVAVDQQTRTSTMSVNAFRAARERYEERFGDRAYFMENLMVSVFFDLHMPYLTSREELWKSYVNFCNVYSVFRFMAVMSCREGAPGDREELFQLLVHASRELLHNSARQTALRDDLFKNDSATLAHMAVLLGS